jgi:hypothetical protein
MLLFIVLISNFCRYNFQLKNIAFLYLYWLGSRSGITLRNRTKSSRNTLLYTITKAKRDEGAQDVGDGKFRHPRR